jgi:hypothetical protein
MIFKIPAGKHYARPFLFWLWFRKRIFRWRVIFSDSCVYDLQSQDQADVNKLCGIGFLPGHHVDSARFGWRYDIERKQIELLAYCYVNNTRIIKPICLLDINKPYYIELAKLSGTYEFHCSETDNINDPAIGYNYVNARQNKALKYKLNPYFGGNRAAPHNIYINLKRIL